MPNLGASQIGVNLMLVAGPRLDGARLTAAVHRVLPDASVTLRATALAALTTAPVLQAARTALTQGLAVSSQVRRTIAIRDGKTSSETIRHAATDERGETTLHARDYATLDRAGRVQLPREMTRRLGMRNRVELQEEPDHIGVWPDQAADQERQ